MIQSDRLIYHKALQRQGYAQGTAVACRSLNIIKENGHEKRNHY